MLVNYYKVCIEITTFVPYNIQMTRTTYGAFIRTERERHELSQQAVADRLGVARSTYLAVERGTKELTLSEAAQLAELFGITIDELLHKRAPEIEKYKDMLLAYLRAAKVSGTSLKKTKLAKLLYLADFSWYYTHLNSMSGMTYRKLDYGPVPDSYFSLLEEMELKGELNILQVLRDDYHMYEIKETRASEKIPLDHLSSEELNHLQQIWEKWKDAKTEEIVRFTHNQLPYKFSDFNAPIPYELITQEDPEYVY